MRQPVIHSVKRGLLQAALVALLVQSFYPTGLMPGDLDDGWVAALCPKGLPMGFAHRLGLHGAHHGEHTDNQTLGDCQLGSAAEQPLSAAWSDALVPGVVPQTWVVVPRPPTALAPRGRFHDTRAPPYLS